MWRFLKGFASSLRRGAGALWLGLALNLAAAPTLPAPPGAYSFKGYGVDQGLTNLSITAMTQDGKGFIWVGTEDGLFRLEGGRMRRFGVAEGLLDAGVDLGGLSPTADGGMWVVTTRDRQFFWDGTRFGIPVEVEREGFAAKPGLALPRGGMIFLSPDFRRILFTTPGLHRELTGLPRTRGLRAGWLSPDGTELLLIIDTTLWVQKGTGWIRRDLSSHLKGLIPSVLKDRRGRIWVRSMRGLIRLDSPEGPIEDFSDRAALGGVDTCFLAEDALGRIWTNTTGSLVWYGENDWGLLGEEEGLPHGGANVLLVDREGSLWAGGDGVHRLLGGFLWTGYTRRQGLPAHIVWSIARSKDGLLWAGTSGGLAVGDGKKWTLVPGTSQRQFTAFAEDPKGNLWCGPDTDPGEPARLFVHKAGTAGVEEIHPAGLQPGDSVWTIAWDPRGFLWVGAGFGLFRLAEKGGVWSATAENIPGWPKGPGQVFCVSVGAGGGVWIAAVEGLGYWDGKAWQTLGKDQGLEDPVLMSVAALGPRSAWFSYRNMKILSRAGLKNGRLAVLETYRDPHPLANNPITSLKLDSTGALWMGTSLGVKRWDGRQLERFGRDWGLPGEDCAQNALWIDPNGDVWAGLSVGIGHYHLAADLGPAEAVRSEITDIHDGLGKVHPAGPEAFEVPWRWRTLTFFFASQSYLNESSLRRQVRLVGFEEEWRDIEGREARYTGLPAGAFTFEVRSGRANRTWGPTTAQSFVILKPWWQTWGFYALAFALGSGILHQGFLWRERLLRRRMVELETQVHERTWDLEEANKALEEASMVDPLTGLKNRRFLRLAIPEAEARSVRVHRHAQGEMALGEDILFLLVDLDHFKQVNDTHGHPAGDAVLVQVAELLRGACRESDTLVRWGGEEFLIVAAGADRFTAEVIAENICNRFRAAPFHLPGDLEIHQTCSVGFTAFPLLPGYPSAHPWEGAVEVADQCLYAVKKSGRDGWVGVFRGDMEATDELREQLPQNVAGLVKKGGLTLRCSFPNPEALAWMDPSGSKA